MNANDRNLMLQLTLDKETAKMHRMDAVDFWNLREPIIDQWFYAPDGTLTGAAFHYRYRSATMGAWVRVDVDMYRRTMQIETYDACESYTGRMFVPEYKNLLDYLADVIHLD